MARSVNFQYMYPYDVRHDNSRYLMKYDDVRTTLNGNYTTPLTFIKANPYIIKVKIEIVAYNESGSSILNRSWNLYYYNGSWQILATFTMPENGKFTWEGTMGSSCQKFAAVPTATQGTGTEWSSGINIKGLWVQESLTTVDFSSDYFLRIFTVYQEGIEMQPCQVSVNIDDTLIRPSKVLVNVNDTIIEIPSAYIGTFASLMPDSMRLFEFTPLSSGNYKIDVILHGGNHEARLYNSSFTQMHPNGVSGSEGQCFYNGIFTLTSSSPYYISLTHNYTDTRASDSMLTITKT